ncbi:DNA2/NAM7 family helicase [Paenibacillus sp. CC-CFT747]|nr:DNA2/NAM7 family helicase [Paenibacillus sp. CC-CFT747]
MEASKKWADELSGKLLQLFREPPAAAKARGQAADRLVSGKEAFEAAYGSLLERFLTAWRTFQDLEERLARLLQLDFAALDERRGGGSWFAYRTGQARLWKENIDSLREWCSWRQVRGRAADAGLDSVLSAYEGGRLQHAEVTAAFERGWWKAAIQYGLEADPQLASFSGRLFEEKIKAFQETVDTFEQLTRQEISARLAANLPPLHSQAAASSEAGILLRAIRSGGRGLSLRKLFEQIPNLLSRLCPCVLMSPMSVAQYLDPKHPSFDLVLFDEASQLPTSEAVGAMARGRNVIVVGDPKQLPPTSFFAHSGAEEADEAVVPEDLESILDDCLALGMPEEHLLWHYRSRHESLIAFSNRHFYENKLLTFPSPLERKSNVRWHPVDGFYDRGKTKQNRAEAEQVIQEIISRLKDPQLRRRSIGVVTFNSIQQTLIEDLLDEAFRQDPELEQLASRLHEPLFIKNLENVQGDERDVILFSIGYGPDASGKVVLNFGPLNRDGGWRRLNVAVSRARYEMHVFSTLRAEHLDVSRTRAEG